MYAFVPSFILIAILLIRSGKDIVTDWWDGKDLGDIMPALNLSLLLFCGLDIYVLS